MNNRSPLCSEVLRQHANTHTWTEKCPADEGPVETCPKQVFGVGVNLVLNTSFSVLQRKAQERQVEAPDCQRSPVAVGSVLTPPRSTEKSANPWRATSIRNPLPLCRWKRAPFLQTDQKFQLHFFILFFLPYFCNTKLRLLVSTWADSELCVRKYLTWSFSNSPELRLQHLCFCYYFSWSIMLVWPSSSSCLCKTDVLADWPPCRAGSALRLFRPGRS